MMKKATALILSVLMVFALFSVSAVAETDESEPLAVSAVSSSYSYNQYLSDCPDAAEAENAVEVDLASSNAAEVYDGYESLDGISVLSKASDTVTFPFSVSQSAYYTVSVKYFQIAGETGSISRDLLIDGKLPFAEAEQLTFERIWDNESEEPIYDIAGNQIMPFQSEAPQWVEKTVSEDSGLYGSYLYFYLESGAHTLTLAGRRGDMVIGEIKLNPQKADKSYKDAVKEYGDKEKLSSKDEVLIEGENADRKSDQTMYPQADRSSPLTQPYDFARIIYNTIGASQWKTVGQWLEWDFSVENGGLCQIALHYKQALKSGNVSVRELTIDGEVPFAEARDLTFSYNSSWKLEYLSDKDGNPFLFYLTPGKHTIRLKAVLGNNSEILSLAKDCLNELNSIYRKIVVVTGVSPDLYRDYNLESYIPETLERLKTVEEMLKTLEKEVQKRNESGSQNTSDIKRLYIQVEQMYDEADDIPKRLKNFKDNMASFGTWINTSLEQPLEIDYIKICAPKTELSKGDAGFFGVISHYFKQFCASFVMDYTTIGQLEESNAKSITAWMTSGRDQAQVLKQLVNSRFTPTENISVNLQLVTAGTLLPALLAGIGPDVALGLTQAEPVNMALRGAIINLSEFDDIDEVAGNFHEASLEPFRFNGDIYSIPETTVYPMLFYRKDVLEELGIKTDDLATWDGVLNTVLPRLQNSSLSFGIMPNMNNYLMFLYQRGGLLYSENGIKSKLDSAEAISSMKDYTMLYTQYGLSLSYDFANRFRSGELPVAISDFTAYNQLSIFAPEIKNLWGMLPVPGTLREDGTIDHSSVTTVTGSVMLCDTKEKEACWKFMKWWASTDVQTAYGSLLESIVGSAARYNSANKYAFESVSWDNDIKQNLIIQSDSLRAKPEVPGGYYTTRLYDFSFRNIVYDGEDVRETMNSTAEDVNREIENKRTEYQLPME